MMQIMEQLAFPCLFLALVLALFLPVIRRSAEAQKRIEKLKEKGIIK